MATSGIQHNVDAQETEQPKNKRRRLAGDGESHAEWPQTASEPKAASARGEQSAPSIQQHGSQFGGYIVLGPGASFHQGNNIYQGNGFGKENWQIAPERMH